MSIHIAFLSLFLSLTSGSQKVELSLGGAVPQVAAVEILLDGATAATLKSPPWEAKVDFGPTLLPHELVARALDADGRELARARQWVNLPRPPAEVEIALEENRGVRLSWQQVIYERPSAIRLSLDGAPLAVDAQGRAALPDVDAGLTHVLTAELQFPSGTVARKDVVFGGERGETFTELTAVPLRVLNGGELPALDKLQGWFLAGGKPVKVAAVEDEVGELFVVRVPGRVETRSKVGPGMVFLDSRLRNYLKLGKGDQVRFVSPQAHIYQGSSSSTRVHDVTSGISTRKNGLYFLLVDIEMQGQGTGTPRAADAVAVAGLTALAGEHRRAVLLVLGEKSQDASFYKPDEIRRYLDAVRVPLFVWSLGDPKLNPELAIWGPAEDITSSQKLNLAFTRLRNELRAQRIVWLEGRHLPQAISLAPAAKGIELVAGRPLS